MIMNVCHKDNLKVKCLSEPTSDSSIYIYTNIISFKEQVSV